MQDLVSVIIPVYNAANYLVRCLDSVCGQTYGYLEIICVNDGSTDESGSILNERAKEDSRLKIINQENKGVSSARNLALMYASGKYVTMIDADDRVEDSMIEKMVEAAELSSADMVITGLKCIEQGNKIVESFSKMPCGIQDAVIADFFVHYCPAPYAKLYRTEIIRTHGIQFDSGLVVGEDVVFIAIYWHYARSVFVINESLYIYNASNGLSATSKFSRGLYPMSVYLQTISLPCIIYDILEKRQNGVKTLSEWRSRLLLMQLIEHEWVMNAVSLDEKSMLQLKALSQNCYNKLAANLSLFHRVRVNVYYRIGWVKGQILRRCGIIKRFLFSRFYSK